MGRDVTSAVPGGFQSAGAVNGNLRARAASILLEGALGVKTLGGSADTFAINDAVGLPWFTVEKKVGSATPLQLILQYQDAMVNTLSLSGPSGALATFSAGLITCSEVRTDRTNAGNNPLAPETYPVGSDDLLVFHGGRIMMADNPTGVVGPKAPIMDTSFQSCEVALNNNIDASEYTIQPSRFLRSLTPGIRQLDLNFTIVFDSPDKYSQYAFGAQANNTPGYSFYMGSMMLFLGNFQLLRPDLDLVGTTFPYVGASNAKTFVPATPGTNVYLPGGNGPSLATPAAPGDGSQGVQINIPKLAFTGFPVALTSGRIVVTTSARGLRDNSSTLMSAYVAPGGAGLNY